MPEKTITRIDLTKSETANTTKKPKVRVAAYARVSTERDTQENSLQSQKDFFVRYIRSNSEWRFAGLYIDDGVSGVSYHNREGFKNMVQDALDGKIDRIITKSLSRFARNTVDALTTIRKLKAANVGVLFFKENIDTMGPNGEFLITLMSSFAEEESRSISENIKWALRRRFAQGKYSMAYSSFLGYRRGEDGVLEIDADGAEVVRFIYWLAFQGINGYSISKVLTQCGIPTPCGKTQWQTRVIYSILTNEKYKGDALLQKTVRIDFLTHKSKPNTGEAPQYYIEHDHPAIIRRDIWEEIQDKVTILSNHKSIIDPLCGKIVCGECGGYYGRKLWHSTTTRDIVWECNRKKKGETRCNCTHLYDYELVNALLSVQKRLYSKNPEVINDCLDFCHNKLEIDSEQLNTLTDRRDDMFSDGLHFDDAAVRLLIDNVKITLAGNAVFRMIDGSFIQYRISAITPTGRLGMNEIRQNHQMVDELFRSGMRRSDIARELGINYNTVYSYIRRKNNMSE